MNQQRYIILYSIKVIDHDSTSTSTSVKFQATHKGENWLGGHGVGHRHALLDDGFVSVE